MRKISEILVKRRYIFLSIMIVVTIICGVFTQKVNIITDMTTFLPDNSSMKHGIDIMSEEFGEMSSGGSIRLMSTDLSENDKSALLDELSAIPDVKSVDYDANSADYNRNNHSLFVINSDYDFDSEQMHNIIQNVRDNVCPKYNLVYDISDTTSGNSLPPHILALALGILLVILFVMCESWFEPVIFLITIGIAVVINAGTNVLLSGVSETTNSIAAILQLVLSMDYSIILINRYRQELTRNSDNVTAMTNAVRYSASSIVSSSMTTVVGLLALVFMSFKIGADMGIVLAKGVFISMICIFTVLPALILLFNKVISKSAKKVPVFRMDKFAGFIFKTRFAFPVILIVFFAVVFVLKNSTVITYTMSQPSEIVEVFPKTNAIVTIYKTADEEKISEIIPEIQKENGVESVQAYSTTLGKQYTAEELSEEIGSMSGDMKLEPWMLKFIYFNFYNGATPPMSLNDFIVFVGDFTNKNPDLLGNADSNMLEKLDMMKVFTDKNELSKQRSAEELSAIFGSNVSALYSITGKEAMNITEFLQTAESLSGIGGSVSPEALQQLETARLFANPDELAKERTAAELAKIFGIDETMLSQLLMSAGAEKASVQTLVAMLQNPQMSAMLPPEMSEKMQMISLFTNPAEMSKQRSADEISAILGLDKALISAMGRETISIAEMLALAGNMVEMPRPTAFKKPLQKGKIGV